MTTRKPPGRRLKTRDPIHYRHITDGGIKGGPHGGTKRERRRRERRKARRQFSDDADDLRGS